MSRTSLATLTLLLTLGCGDPKDDTAGPDDTDTTPAGDCETDPGGYPLATGRYEVLTDEAISLGCENAAGNGMHIHVGQTIPMDFSQAGACVQTVVEPDTPGAMVMEGMSDGAEFTLQGSMDFEYGTCVLLIEATMVGTLTADSTFDYRTDATLSIKEELSPDACSFIVGDTEQHTFPSLPCSWAWAGSGAPE